ncbi:MAG TPA: hypothetical protein PKV73_07375, partial [Agriterribacter sp.]|nr:hypothetical protein [Agriterribacter sp.]
AKAWLEENEDRTEVFFIPSFSPEPNEQEYLDQAPKPNVIGKKYPINKAAMRNNIDQFMTKRKNNGILVQKYFHATQVRYAA